MAKPPPTIAVTSTLAMVRTAELRGVETATLLEEAGVTRECLEDPDARLPGPTVMALWNALRERTGDPALQLFAPGSLPFGAYRVIEYLVATSATVGEGVERFARFFQLIAEAVNLSICRDEEGPCLCLAAAEGGQIPPVYVDYVFAALVTRIRMRIRPQLQVRRLDLCRPEPPASAVYAEVFCAPVRFGAPEDRLCFGDDEWNQPMETADEALGQVLEEHARILGQRVSRPASGFLASVEHAITSAPQKGGSADHVARALFMSVRTLQRKLVAHGTTFRDVSDAVLGRLAEGYLRDRKVSVAEVAFLLGFSEPSSFNRAFRRWTGETPGRWRRRQA